MFSFNGHLRGYSCLLQFGYILKLSVKSPSLPPPISSAFTPYSLFQWYLQSNVIFKSQYEILKHNIQCLRVITVIVQVGAVKIYVGAVEALRKKERGDETQFTTKFRGKTSLGPSYFVRNNDRPAGTFRWSEDSSRAWLVPSTAEDPACWKQVSSGR